MACHARRPRARARSALRAGVVLSAAGFAALSGAGAAQADIISSLEPEDTVDTVGHVLAPAKRLQLDPFANTGVDPLNNGVTTQVADFRQVGTTTLTDPITQGASVTGLPVVGGVARLLPG